MVVMCIDAFKDFHSLVRPSPCAAVYPDLYSCLPPFASHYYHARPSWICSLLTVCVRVAPSGDGTVHRGEILAFKEESGQHQVFYEDGEDEWVDLAVQKVDSWQEPVRGVVTAPGLPEGASLI